MKVPWKARRASAAARREVRRMAIRVISSDERQSRRPQTSVARRVTRHSRPTVGRMCHCLAAAAIRYAIGPKARNAACVTFTTGCWLAFLTRWRGEVRERASGTRSQPGGGKKAPTTRPLTRRAAQASASSEVFTKHESRDTNHGFYAFPVARLVPVGTEALQSCFFCPGLLGIRTGCRKSPGSTCPRRGVRSVGGCPERWQHGR